MNIGTIATLPKALCEYNLLIILCAGLLYDWPSEGVKALPGIYVRFVMGLSRVAYASVGSGT
ncbi:hypothetical protein [Pontibacter silvestris]|uniref:hypothetical protein n=1 Tax=Pontibacter silvestris TaxID=2305183 RepID=UPI00367178E4